MEQFLDDSARCLRGNCNSGGIGSCARSDGNGSARDGDSGRTYGRSISCARCFTAHAGGVASSTRWQPGSHAWPGRYAVLSAYGCAGTGSCPSANGAPGTRSCALNSSVPCTDSSGGRFSPNAFCYARRACAKRCPAYVSVARIHDGAQEAECSQYPGYSRCSRKHDATCSGRPWRSAGFQHRRYRSPRRYQGWCDGELSTREAAGLCPHATTAFQCGHAASYCRKPAPRSVTDAIQKGR